MNKNPANLSSLPGSRKIRAAVPQPRSAFFRQPPEKPLRRNSRRPQSPAGFPIDSTAQTGVENTDTRPCDKKEGLGPEKLAGPALQWNTGPFGEIDESRSNHRCGYRLPAVATIITSTRDI